jgi:molecular chaperone Hsp33
MAALLTGVDHTLLGESPVVFHCPCDRDRVRGAAAALGEDEIHELLIKEADLLVTCDYCRERYTLGVLDYRKILDAQQE